MPWLQLKGGIVVTLVLSFCSAAGVFRDPWIFQANLTSTQLTYDDKVLDQPHVSMISSSWTSWHSDFGVKYDTCLDEAPLFTKAITAAFISGLGDLLAQFLDSSSQDGRKTLKTICWNRVAGVMTDGLLISGPLMHLVYSAMERNWPTADSFWAPMAHVMIDELLLDAVSVLTFFVFTGIFTGKRITDIVSNLKGEFGNAFLGGKATSLLLLPVMLYQFRYVPEKYRVLIVGVGDIGWYAVTSHFCNRLAKPK